MNQSARFLGVQRVYKLMPLQFALSSIALRRLKISRFSELNDPFEMLAVDLFDFDLRAGIHAKKAQIDSLEGLLCFSRRYCNPLLWSHYADRHRGVALGFDVPTRLLTDVRYIAGMKKLRIGDETAQAKIDAFLHELRFKKFEGWRYEEEVRQLFRLADLTCESNMHFVPFTDDLTLREVILGPWCEAPIDAVGALVEGFPGGVCVSRARLAHSEFSVVSGKRYRSAEASSSAVLKRRPAGGGIAALLPPRPKTP